MPITIDLTDADIAQGAHWLAKPKKSKSHRSAKRKLIATIRGHRVYKTFSRRQTK